MLEKKKLTLYIIVVILIVLLVVSGTYAYWKWVSANNTTINFSVAGGTISIDGGGNIETEKKLAPSSCINTKYAIQRKIKVIATNDSNTDMVETIQLKVKNMSTTSGTLNSTNKASIEWALVRADENQYNANTWLEATTECASLASEVQSDTKGTMLSRGTFQNVSTNGVLTIYDKDIVPANDTATDYYELYIWINPNYEGEATTGTTVNDALQDLILNLEWQGNMTNAM